MMTRRAYGTERGVALAGAQRFDGSQTGAGGQARRLETRWACVRVGIEPTASAGADRLDPLEVPGRVHSFEIRPSGGLWFERGNGVAKVGMTHPLEDCVESLRSLGMAWPGKMFEVHRMSGEQHGHAVGRYLPAAESELPFHP